jgi:pyruvate kinase
VHAECVMLNKGPYIEQAVKTLDNILRRMEAHSHKKRQLYRPLKVAQF